MSIDIFQTKRFLAALGSAPFVFQTYTDNKQKRKTQRKDPLQRKLIGTFEEHQDYLQHLSRQGAGVFVQVNEVSEEVAAAGLAGDRDLIRKKESIAKVRSLFIDLDTPDMIAKSMESLKRHMPQPSCMVQSSPGKCHLYWFVDDCPVENFKVIQASLATRFGGDTAVATKERVMRLPGFPHQKIDILPTSFTPMSLETYTTAELCESAAGAPDMIMPGSTIVQDAQVTDVFGLDIGPTYQAPAVLAEGNRTQPLISHIGHMIASGYSAEYTEAEIRRMNVDLCPEGQDPISEEQLEFEILGFIDTCAKTRDAESPHTIPPPPPPPTTNSALAGSVPPPPSAPPAPAAPLAGDTNTEVQQLEKWLNRFLFCEDGSYVIDRHRQGTKALYKFEEFKRKYSNVFVGDKAKLCNKWLDNPQRQDVRCTAFVPNGLEILTQDGAKMWNIYEPSHIKPATKSDPDVLAIFHEHIRVMFPDPGAAERFLDWMAMSVRRPEIRIPWVPLLVSAPGAGKGFLFKVMSKMMGVWNCNMIGADRLDNQFNGYIASSTLVCIDEMKVGSSRTSDKLKNLITESRIELNEKGKQEKVVEIFANMIIFSNHLDAAAIEHGDRRYWVVQIPTVPSPEYFMRLFNWHDDDENIAHLLRWVWDRDLSNFNYASPPPNTAAKEQMRVAGTSEIEEALCDGIEMRSGPFAADVVSYPTVAAYIMDALALPNMERAGPELRLLWMKASDPLPSDRNRVRLHIGKAGQVRVRIVRNPARWMRATQAQLADEATRAAQMMFTPESVDAPHLELV